MNFKKGDKVMYSVGNSFSMPTEDTLEIVDTATKTRCTIKGKDGKFRQATGEKMQELRIDPIPEHYAGIQLKTDKGHLQVLYRCPECDGVMDCLELPFGQNLILCVPLDNKNYLEFVCPNCGGRLQLSSLFIKKGEKNVDPDKEI